MIRFDSQIDNPYSDAIDIISSFKQYISPVTYDVEYMKKQ